MKQHSGISRVLAFALAWMLCLSLALPAAAAENGDVINIKTVDDLLELAENCRLDTWSRGKNVILQADISLDGVDFQPIPSFGGTFNGCGHTISGLTLYDSVTPAGLFGTVQQGGTVKNLTVSGTISPSGKAENVGGIVGINGGTLRNCTFTGTIKGKTSVGGIAGMNEVTGKIADCKTSGSMKGEKMTGGIVGCNLGMVTGCKNNSFINTVSADKTINPENIDLSFVMDMSKLSSLDTRNAATDTGGIAGYSSGILGRCTNQGTIGYPHVGYNVGGVVGRSCGYLYSCRNSALVYGRKDVGGITGQMEPFIAANMTEDTLGKLQRQLDELDALLNQAMEDAVSGMGSVTSRLNSMAGNVGGAAAGLNDIQTTATIEGSASGSSEGEVGGSITVSPPQLDLEAGAGGISGGGVVITPGGGAGGSGALIEGSISGGLTEGGASGEGGSSLGGSVSASTQITMTTSLNGVASSLYGLSSQMRALSGEMAGVTGTLKADITAINEKVNEVTDTAYDLFLGDGNQDILIDSSEMDIDLITLGKIKDCENSGEINGDINIGGIAGTMALEYELDPEDDLSSQTDDSERRKYEVKAVVQDCVNTGTITAKRSCVGGIAGRMDLGMIAHAENYGLIQSESGDYVGGIAGITSSTVRNCFSKCTLSGGSYIGGIVGSGVGKNLDGSYSNVVSCCSMVEIPEYEQFVGAISGDRAGSFLENYFVSDTLAGINGKSYSGEAEPILYDELIAKFQQPEPTEPEDTEDTEDPQAQEETEETEPEQPAQPYLLPDGFRQFTLRFDIDGETVDKRTFHYGDSFGDSVYPEIPEKEGYYACWDLDSLENLNFDTVVTAVYSPYTTALSSRDKRENGRSVFYAEGEFVDSAELITERRETIPDDLDLVTTDLAEIVKNSCSGRKLYRQVLECWNLTIPEDGLNAHTLRFLPPEGKNERLSVLLKEGGQWHEVDSAYIGNYLTFQAEGEEVEMALLSTVPVWWGWVLPIVLAVLLLWLLILLIRRIFRKHKICRMQRIAVQQMPPLPPKRRNRKGLLVTLIVLLILALFAGGCAAIYLYNPGIGDSIQAYRVLQLSAGEKQLAMTLTVDAAYGDQTV